MDCKKIRSLLDDQVQGSLSAAERADFDQHIAGCRTCYALASVDELLLREPIHGPRPDLLNRIVAGLTRTKSAGMPSSKPIHWPAMLGPIAACALVLSLMFVASIRTPRTAVSPESAEASASVAPAPAVLARYLEGQQYTRLPTAIPLSSLGDRISAWVFYMWSCLHCYEFEALLDEWVSANSEFEVEIVRVPVQWNALSVLHARAFYTAEALGVSDQINDAFFRAIHEDGRLLDTVSDIESVFGSAGIDSSMFGETFESAAIDDRMAAFRQIARQIQIDAVPAIVIDGVYKTTPATAGSAAAMLEVVAQLARAKSTEDNASSSSPR